MKMASGLLPRPFLATLKPIRDPTRCESIPGVVGVLCWHPARSPELTSRNAVNNTINGDVGLRESGAEPDRRCWSDYFCIVNLL